MKNRVLLSDSTAIANAKLIVEQVEKLKCRFSVPVEAVEGTATFAKALLSTTDYLMKVHEKSRVGPGCTQGQQMHGRLGREPVAKLRRQNNAQGRCL